MKQDLLLKQRSYPQMATIAEVATIFNLPPYFIRARARQGANWVVKAGRKYFVNCDKFVSFLNGYIDKDKE